MSELSAQRVKDAYDALMSGDRARAAEYWDPDVRFLTPGNHQYAGWHEGLEAFPGGPLTWTMWREPRPG